MELATCNDIEVNIVLLRTEEGVANSTVRGRRSCDSVCWPWHFNSFEELNLQQQSTFFRALEGLIRLRSQYMYKGHDLHYRLAACCALQCCRKRGRFRDIDVKYGPYQHHIYALLSRNRAFFGHRAIRRPQLHALRFSN
jgi:hypothetical protein